MHRVLIQGLKGNLNVHWALQLDRQPKPYGQALLTMRRIGAEGFGLKERAWNDRSAALRWRQLWALMANICLAAHGHSAWIDHRSYAERGIALEPQNKVGPNAARRAARGEPSERMDVPRAIARRNAERSAGRAVLTIAESRACRCRYLPKQVSAGCQTESF